MVGRTISHYQIVDKLGEGGMGVVYKARDTHLDRFVAVKILPPEKIPDLDSRLRFVQEAKAASALNHPNIVTIYDIEHTDGVDLIAMEYVRGKTLDCLIPGHGLRVREVLKYAVQIADALAKAHSAGIVHRDLKPNNVIVTDDGLVKLLDFGLAKLMEPATPDLKETDCTTSLRPHTEEGAIVGTVSYMSPEQVEGKKVDARSDIFSFGALLYEMVTGHVAFRGTSKIATLAAILREDPNPPGEFVKDLPQELERIVSRCLRKDPARRLQHMDDLKGALEDLEEESESNGPKGLDLPEPPPWWRRWVWLGGAFLVAVAAVGIRYVVAHGPASGTSLKTVPFTSYLGWEADPSFSPEGTRVAFTWNGPQQDNSDIYEKQIGEEMPQRLTSDPAEDFSPAWSPDGLTIAFLRTQKDGLELLSVPAVGATRETKLAQLHFATPYRSYPNRELAWSPDSAHIVFFDRPLPGEPPGLFLLSIATREKRRLTSCPEKLLRDSDPAFSPDGRTLAFTRLTNYSFSNLYLLTLSPDLRPVGELQQISSEHRMIFQPTWTPDGQEIVFCTRVSSSGNGLWRIAVPGSGKAERLPFDGDQLDISRQGHRLVYNARVWAYNIWHLEIPSHGEVPPPVRLISSTQTDTNPQYSPDGQKVVFASTRSGNFEIWTCNADGSNAVQLTRLGAGESGTPRWFPDGRRIIFDSDKQSDKEKEGNFHLYVVDAMGGAVRRLTDDPATEATPSVSRDGRTIYFSSKRTGPWEVWRMPAEGGQAVQVTRKGGFSPFEGPGGDVLYYQKGEDRFSEVWRVPVGGGEETRVLESVGDRRFAVRGEGIYFVEWPDYHSEAWLQFLSFSTGRTKRVTRIEGPFLTYDLGLTVSPDGRSVLYTHPDHPNSDLMMVENFR